jgi:hypothetical protein
MMVVFAIYLGNYLLCLGIKFHELLFLLLISFHLFEESLRVKSFTLHVFYLLVSFIIFVVKDVLDQITILIFLGLVVAINFELKVLLGSLRSRNTSCNQMLFLINHVILNIYISSSLCSSLSSSYYINLVRLIIFDLVHS